MSLTGISSLEWARRKFIVYSMENMSKNFESNVFVLRRPEMSLTAISSLELARRKFS